MVTMDGHTVAWHPTFSSPGPPVSFMLGVSRMIQPELKTKRLLLRKFQLDDASEVQKLAGNFNVAKMTLNIPFPYEPGMAEAWISTHDESGETKTRVVYAIVNLVSHELLGTISLVRIDGSQGELGYWIGEPYWGMGYCTESARELIRFSFQNLGLEKIVAEHLTANPASGKVMEKAGMNLRAIMKWSKPVVVSEQKAESI